MNRQEQQAARADRTRHLRELRQNPHPAAQSLANKVEKWPPRAFAGRKLSDLSPDTRDRLQAWATLSEAARQAGVDPTGEIGDIIALLNPDGPEAERLEAAERMAGRFPKPIHQRRWRRVLRALQDAPKGMSPVRQLRERRLAAIFNAVWAAEHSTPGELPLARKAIHARLNALMTDDVLGPGWRHAGHQTALDEADHKGERDPAGVLRRGRRIVQAQPSPLAAVETTLRVEQALGRAGLSQREDELVALLLAGCTLTQAAEQMGIQPPTARVLFGRVKKKLRDSL